MVHGFPSENASIRQPKHFQEKWPTVFLKTVKNIRCACSVFRRVHFTEYTGDLVLKFGVGVFFPGGLIVLDGCG